MKEGKIYYIGIVGLKGSGKTTLANYMKSYIESIGAEVIVIPFAFGIKSTLTQLVANSTDLSLQEAHQYFVDPKLKEVVIPGINATARDMMIKFGTDFVRNINEDLWINYTRKSVNEVRKLRTGEDKDLYIIFDDIRFENEFNFVKYELKGLMQFISNNPVDFDNKSIFDIIRSHFKKTHVTEKGLYHLCLNYNEMILNTGSLKYVETRAHKTIDKLRAV